MMRKLVGIAVSFLILLLVLPLMALQFDFVQKAVLARAIAAINRSIPGTLEIAVVEGNFVSHVSLKQIKIWHEGKLIATAAEVVLDWNPLALITRDVSVRLLGVRQARISLAKGDDERIAFVAAFSNPATGPEHASKWQTAVAQVDLRDVLFTQPGTDETKRYWIQAGRLHGAYGGDELAVQLESLSGAISSPGVAFAKGEGNVVVHLQKAAPVISVQGFAIEAEGSRFALEGIIDLNQDGEAAVRVHGRPVSVALLAALNVPVKLPLELSADARGPWQALEFAAAITSAGGGLSLTGSAAIPFTEPTFPGFQQSRVRATGKLVNFRPDVWFGESAPGNTRINADVDIRFEMAPDGQPRMRTAFDGADSFFGGYEVHDFVGEVSYAEKVAAVEMRLDSPRGSADMEARYDRVAEAYRGRVKVSGLHPQDFLGEPWHGKLSFSANVVGRGTSLETLTAKARLTVGPSQLGGYQIDSISLPLAIEQGRVTIHDGRIRTEPLDARISGNLPVAPKETGTLRLLARTENLGALFGATAEAAPLTGRGMLHVVAQGSLSRLRADITLRGQALQAGEMNFPDVEVSGEVRDANVLNRTGRVELLAEATLPDFGIIGFQSARVAASLIQKPGMKQEGTILVSTEDTGTENRIRGKYELDFPHVKLTLQDFALKAGETYWVNAGESVIDSQRAGIKITNFELNNGEQQISINGLLDRSGQQQLQVHFNRVQIAPFSALLGKPGEFGGELDGTAWLSGTLEKPQIESTFVLANGAVRGYQVALAAITISYAQAWVDAQVRLSQSKETGALVANVRLPLALGSGEDSPELATRKISGRIVSENLSLEIMKALTPQITDVRGLIDVDVTLAGTLTQLRLGGTIEVSNGAFRVSQSGAQYSGLAIVAKVKESYVEVTRLRVTSKGDGELSATGRIPIPLAENAGRVQVAVIAKNFLVVDNDIATARLDAELNAGGTLEAPTLAGTIVSEHVVVNMPKGGQKDLAPLEFQAPGIHIVGEPGSGGGKGEQVDDTVRLSLLERATVNVTVSIDRNSWVRGDDVNIELRGGLRVQKAAGDEDVRITGEINTVRGYYQLRSKRLTVEEGSVQFTGTRVINPLLDITLSYETPEYEIGVHVTGTTQNPNLGLTSQPPLETADIVAVLVFGKPFGRLGSGEQVGMRERVGNLLGGFAAEQLRDQLGGRLGIDTLDIRPSGDTEAEGAEVGVGKYVSEDVFVQYVQRFGAEAASEVRLEYYFSSRWLVQTSATTEGESGADVFWNVTF